MRIVIAALIGAIAIFIWQTISHTFLPIGEMGFRQPASEESVMQSIASGMPESGIYMLPSLDPAKWGDEAAMAEWETRAKANRFSFVVVSPPQENPASMAKALTVQFICSFIMALVIAWLLAAAPWSFGMRVAGSGAIGIGGWVMNSLPLWGWYKFPADYAVGTFLDQTIGWTLAGLGIAWWLGRKRRTFS